MNDRRAYHLNCQRDEKKSDFHNRPVLLTIFPDKRRKKVLSVLLRIPRGAEVL
jgi:hypothetical protein